MLRELRLRRNNLEECLPRELVDRSDLIRGMPSWDPCEP